MEQQQKSNTAVIVWIIVIIIVIGAIWIYEDHRSSTAPATQSTTTATTTTTGTPSTSSAPNSQPIGSGVGSVGSGQSTVVGGAVMSPNQNVVLNAEATADLSTLVSLIQASGLTATLEKAGPYTVFAPTNSAFAKLSAGTVSSLMEPANKAELVNLLEYHVVSGSYTSHDLFNGEVLGTLAGKNLTIGKSATTGQLTVNGVAVVQIADVPSSNGVTFILDTVLTPPTTASN